MRIVKPTVATLVALALLVASVSVAEAAKQNKADGTVHSDLRNIATVMETFYTDHSRYPHARDVDYNGVRKITFKDSALHLRQGDRLREITLTDDGSAYCLGVS